jgi:lipopolysaccharide export system permease protein
LVVFIFLYVVADLFSLLDELLKNSIKFYTIFSYYLWLIPIIVVQVCPMAVLLSSIYILANLSRHNEIIALKASGINLLTILKPLLFMGVLISVLIFLTNDRLVPEAMMKSSVIKEENFRKSRKETTRFIENVAAYGTHNRMIFVRNFNVNQKILNEVIVIEQDQRQKPIYKVTAKEAHWQNNIWLGKSVVFYTLDKTGQVIGDPAVYEEKELDIEEKPVDLLKKDAQAKFMSYRGLEQYINLLALAGGRLARRLKVELYYKLAFPFMNLVIILIGVPFAVNTNRGGTLLGIGISLGVGLSYYGLNAVFLALGRGGFLPPLLAAWMSNILFTAIGSFLLIRKL